MPEAEARMKEINEAYASLSGELKAAYDRACGFHATSTSTEQHYTWRSPVSVPQDVFEILRRVWVASGNSLQEFSQMYRSRRAAQAY